MRRLTSQITATVVLVALITTLLIVAVQVYDVGREQQQLPPEWRIGAVDVIGRAFTPSGAGRVWRGELGLRGIVLEQRARAAAVAFPSPGVAPAVQAFQVSRLHTLFLSGGVAVVLAALLGYLLSRSISRPIAQVSAAAAQVAVGNLAARVAPLPRRAPAEAVLLADTFNTMTSSLEQLEQARRQLIADVAHELRTPLTVMRGRLEAMEDGLVPCETREVSGLLEQVRLLSRLVEDLRLLSLADAGRLSIHPQEVEVGALAASTIGAFALRFEQKRLRCELEVLEPVRARLDPERAQQLLANLLDNAVRHTPEGGWIVVRVRKSEAGVALEVQDSGPGLPPGEGLRLFERFVRADESRQRASGGSGLGLAIVKAIAELHGGSVWAENVANGGARFVAQFPVLACRAKEGQPLPFEAESSRSSGRSSPAK